jgi:hypothetical protein
LAALLAIIAWVYWPGIHGGFVLDDLPNISENPALRVTTLSWRDWVAATLSAPSGVLARPVAMLSFAINHYFTGMHSMPMKVTNIVIHLVNTALVFLVAAGLLETLLGAAQRRRARWIALFVAALWGLHPINLMAVLYVVQRMESLAQVFVLAGLWMYVVGRRRQLAGRSGWLFVAVGLAGGLCLGVLTKESAVMLPVYALCIESLVFRFRRQDGAFEPRIAWLYVMVLLLPALAGLYKYGAGFFDPRSYETRSFDLAERLLTETRVVIDYVRWTVMPDLGTLSLFHDDYVVSHGLLDPPSTLFSLLALGLGVCAAWLWRLSRPMASLGILWFLSAQALTATVIPLELVFEHRNYFASIGICLLLADLLLVRSVFRSRAWVGHIVAGFLVVLCAGITHLRAIEWSDPFRFAVAEATKHPKSPRASYTLARTLVMLTEYKPNSRIVPGAWEAIEAAREAPGSNLLPIQLSLIFAARTGRPIPAAWWAELQHGLRTQPLNIENRMALIALNDCAVDGYCYFPREEMLATFSAALSRGPDAGMLSVYGKYAVHVLHDPNLGLELWEQAATRGPENAQFQINLAWLQISLRRFDEAQAVIERLRRLGMPGQWRPQADELQKLLDDARAASPRNPDNQQHTIPQQRADADGKK